MTIIEILVALAVVTVLLDLGLTRLYKNPKTPHTATPAECGIAFQEIAFPTRNGCRLYGWWMPAQGETAEAAPVLILVHGWGRNVERMLPYIQNLHARGYHLLAFDARNHGSSDSDGHSSLPKFAEDIRAAIDFVGTLRAANAERIGIVGVSLGGAAAIYAAAHDPRIRSVVTIGAFAHPGEIMRLEFQKRHLPYFPLVWLMFKYIQFKIGARFDQIAPMNNIGKASARILLIHGEQDVVIPVEQAKKLKQAGDPERVVLRVLPARGHSDCHLEDGFWQNVDTFLRQTLFGEPVGRRC